MLSNLNLHSGQSLVTVLVAMGLTGVLFMGSMRIIQSLQVQQNILSNAGDQQVLRQELINILSNPSECARSFRDANDQIAKFNPAVSLADPSFISQNTLHQLKSNSLVLAKPGLGNGRFQISHVSLESKDSGTPISIGATPAKRYLANLNVTIENRSDANHSWIPHEFSLPFLVETDNSATESQNNILGCSPRDVSSTGNATQYVRVVRWAAQENNFDTPSTETVSTATSGVRTPPNSTNTFSSSVLPMRKYVLLTTIDTVSGRFIPYEDLETGNYVFDKGDGFDSGKANMPVLPVNSANPLLPLSGFDVSGSLLTRQFDGMQCNLVQGYHLVSCSLGESGTGYTTPPKIYPYSNGCVTPHLRKATSSNPVYLNIICAK